MQLTADGSECRELWGGRSRLQFFMDRHEFTGLTAAEAAVAHLKDLEVQGRFGVRFLTYWFDEERQTAFCLAEAPDADALEAVHRASHGFMAYQIIEVDEPMVERFMGGIVEHPPGEPYVETAFRTILFTDIVESTSLTQQLGDARAMEMLRAHDEIVRRALDRHRGSEVKHTGDGLMAAFPSVVGAIESAVEIQQRLAEARDRPKPGPRPHRDGCGGAGHRAQRPVRRHGPARRPALRASRPREHPRRGRRARPRPREGLRLPQPRQAAAQRVRLAVPAFEVMWRTSGS